MRYLAVDRLSVAVGDHRLLSNISFRLYPGELCALIGPSGAGKSTLIKSMLGLMDFQGHIRLPQKNTPIAYVPQDDHLHVALRVAQELDYACQLRLPASSVPRRRHHIQTIAQQVGLLERLDLPIRQLSGGQRKRVSVALELLTTPDFMILDEPTSGLDPGMDTQMMELFASIAQQQKIVMVATHNMQNIERCQNMLLMQQGHVVFFGPPKIALPWFKVHEFEDIFIRLQQHTASEWAQRYQQSMVAREYAKRLPPAIKQARKQQHEGRETPASDPHDEPQHAAVPANAAADVLRNIRNKKRS
jgi:ABC-type multidrug transport system ATPase subunit